MGDAGEVSKTLRQIAAPFIGAAHQVGGMLEDHLAVVRLERQVALAKRAIAILEQNGLEPAAVPLPVLKPILDEGSLADDEGMVERWANLLAAAATPKRSPEVLPAFPRMLAQLSPAEAALLEHVFRETGGERDKECEGPTLREALSMEKPDYDVAVGNLHRLGLAGSIRTRLAFIEKHRESPNEELSEPPFEHATFELVTITPLGVAFIRAVTPEPRRVNVVDG